MKYLHLILLTLLTMLPLGSICVAGTPTVPYIERFDIEAYLERNDSCFITIMFTLVVPKEYDTEVTALRLPLLERQDIPPREGNITRWETNQGVHLDWTQSMYLSHIMIISFDDPISPGEKRDVRISLSASKGVFVIQVPDNPKGRVFYYRFYQPNISLALESSVLRVYLPPNSILRQFQRYRDLLSPIENLLQIGDEITLGRTTVIWDLATPDVMTSERTVFSCTYSLEEVSEPQSETNTSHTGPVSAQTSLTLIFALNIASALTAFVISWFIFKRGTLEAKLPTVSDIDLAKQTLDEKDLKKIEGIIGQLSSEEIEILRLLARNGGSMKQREIPLNVGFSKSKISRMLKRMENMGLVTRNLVGRTKQVNLSPAFLAYFLSKIQRMQGEGFEQNNQSAGGGI
ncbi:MAG: hypothetical protein DRN90_06665 [Thermoproteota archaeon]|nr:MAG: hypothetical protein DRN90_06665 [Candidatus Korarchaeota archaeon]RLG47549.1 MAG: hypothetical protein DRN92_02955 [Candidatus Korarchaeota archaeon]